MFNVGYLLKMELHHGFLRVAALHSMAVSGKSLGDGASWHSFNVFFILKGATW